MLIVKVEPIKGFKTSTSAGVEVGGGLGRQEWRFPGLKPLRCDDFPGSPNFRRFAF